MNPLWLGAALLLACIGLLHTLRAEWTGERQLVRRIWRLALFDCDGELDLFAKRIVRLAWHLTSVSWWGAAAVLTYLACAETSSNSVAVVRILGVTFLLHSLLSLILVRGRHSSCYAFLMVAILLLVGSACVPGVANHPG